MKRDVNLVLSGGGARGFAHIGVIKVLKRKGYRIRAISGASMGALVGGLEAYGQLEKYEEWITSQSLLDIIKLLEVDIKNRFEEKILIDLDYLYRTMETLFGAIDIEDMSIPFTAVATNLTTQKEIWFQKGSFYDALRASTAIPGYFKPFINEAGHILVDGGVLNIIPIAPTLSSDADITIAVDVNSNFVDEGKYRIEYENTILEKMWRAFFAKKNDIKNSSIDLMMKYIYNLRLYEYKPDILIQIPRSIAETFDFHKHREIIKIGELIAEEKL